MKNKSREIFHKFITHKTKQKNEKLHEYLDTILIYREIKKSELLIKNGEINKSIFFVAKGAFVTSQVTDLGESKAIWFHTNEFSPFLLNNDSFHMGIPTLYEQMAIEDSFVIELKQPQLQELMSLYPVMKDFYIQESTTFLSMFYIIKGYMISYSALDFYKYIKNQYPDLVTRIPKKYLAHFINVTPEWLSKIRKNNRSR